MCLCVYVCVCVRKCVCVHARACAVYPCICFTTRGEGAECVRERVRVWVDVSVLACVCVCVCAYMCVCTRCIHVYVSQREGKDAEEGAGGAHSPNIKSSKK